MSATQELLLDGMTDSLEIIGMKIGINMGVGRKVDVERRSLR
jgi:hypothetical protein